MIYDILYKTLIRARPSFIMFDKENGFIRDFEWAKYLALLSPEKFDTIVDRIRYLIRLKSGISYVFSHNYAKIKIDSDDDWPSE